MSTLATAASRSTAQRQADAGAAARTPGAQRGKKPDVPSFAMVFSMALHLGLAVLLVTHTVSKGERRPPARTTVIISLDSLRETGNPRAAHAQVATPSPQPVPKAASLPPPDAQAAPKPKHAPAPPKPAQAATTPQATAQARAPAAQPKQNAIPTPAQKRGDEGESIGITVLNRVRTNW